MKNNLIIHPSNDFFMQNHNNIFVDVFTHFKFFQNKYSQSDYKWVITKTDPVYKKKNLLLTDKIYYEILSIIKIEFNEIYKKDFDVTFYEIIIGPWLRFFISQFVNKYKTILKAIEVYNIDTCTIYESKNLIFAVDDSASFHHAPNNNEWNAGIYSSILENLKTKIDLKKISVDNNLLFNSKKKGVVKNKNYIRFILNYVSEKIPNFSDKLIYETGLGGRGDYYEKKFEFLLNQLPRYYKSHFDYEISEYNYDLRSKFKFEKYKKKISIVDNEEIELKEIFNLIINILSQSIPNVFVEDFNFMLKFSDNLKFPKKPKLILTTFAYDTNEPFKYYLANKKFNNKNLKYFIYNHGVFISGIEASFHQILKTADNFIGWGNAKNLTSKKCIAHSNYKLLNKKYFVKNNSDKILIMTRSSGSNLSPYDNFTDKLEKISLLTKFLKKIDNKFKLKITIRAHKNTKNIFKNFDSFFNTNEFKFPIDYGNTPYFDAINDSKLIIFGYDSSGMLEILNTNKPFVGLWPNLFDHLDEFAIKDYQILREAKILFDNPDELIEHINSVWDKIDAWWSSRIVQNSLSHFSKNYSIDPDKYFFKNLKKMLLN